LHWADPTTLELIGLIVRELGAGRAAEIEPGSRLLVVLTARPEFVWSSSDVRPLPLSRLDRDEVETMVNAGLSDGRVLPPPVLAEVIRRADGVPLFVEEVTRVLLETRTDDGGNWIPRTLRDLLCARPAALPQS